MVKKGAVLFLFLLFGDWDDFLSFQNYIYPNGGCPSDVVVDLFYAQVVVDKVWALVGRFEGNF